MCGGGGNSGGWGGGWGDDGRDSLSGTSGNKGQSVGSPSGVDSTTTGYNGGSSQDGGPSSGLAGDIKSIAQTLGLVHNPSQEPEPVSPNVDAVAKDLDRARAVVEGYSTQGILGNVGLADDKGLTLGAPATPAGTLQNAAKGVRMTDDETFGEALSRKASNPLDSSALGIAGSVIGTALGMPGGGIVGEVVDAAINREQINITGPGGRYNWDPEAYKRSKATPNKGGRGEGGKIVLQQGATTAAETAANVTQRDKNRARRTQNSTIATSILGDTSYADIIRSRLGGR